MMGVKPIHHTDLRGTYEKDDTDNHIRAASGALLMR